MSTLMSVNTASINELADALQDRERAQAILNARELRGDFKDWEDLRAKVQGIGDRAIDELRDAGMTLGAERH
ncbi:MAG TPA: helix-hairpin-helix domain-containing protein [Polyangiaceae bacterium]|nr:helix-hairpin-helix domain-containing protein [Polyangiaceae bacterium]